VADRDSISGGQLTGHTIERTYGRREIESPLLRLPISHSPQIDIFGTRGVVEYSLHVEHETVATVQQPRHPRPATGDK